MKNRKLVSLIPLVVVLLLVLIYYYSDNNAFARNNTTFGAWAPANFHLEKMQDPDQIYKAISNLMSKGFSEYYFVMRDFNNATEARATEQLLRVADKTNLGIHIILLPPSESGNYGAYSSANYDWKGWINYFNSLKRSHPLSFVGFVMDDFNAIDAVRRLYVRSNINYLFSSDLLVALSGKRNDMQFFPVMYLETGGFKTLKRNYDRFLSGIILAKAPNNDNDNDNDNSTIQLDSVTKMLSNMFKDKPLKYILYPQGDSVSTISRLFNHIIIYIKTDR